MKFDEARLLAALEALPDYAWVPPSRLGVTAEVHHLYQRACLVEDRRPREVAELFRWVFDELAGPVFYAAVTRLGPGGFILPHRDSGPFRERWHVPIVTAGLWGDGSRPVPGEPHRVEHWEPHSVWNDTDGPRVHLLVDLDRFAKWDNLTGKRVPFEKFPVPPEFQHLVDAARDGDTL